MAKTSLYSLLLFFFFSHVLVLTKSSAAAAVNPSTVDFIKASCRATRYPALCVRSLSSYANSIQQNEQQLTQAALTVSLARARSVKAFVDGMARASEMKPREYQAMKDCIDNMGDTVDQLARSIKELGHMGRPAGQDFSWHISNVQTWVSAALTDENTCVDGFAGRAMDGNVKAAIRKRVRGVAQVTSNALALVNRFAERHQKP